MTGDEVTEDEVQDLCPNGHVVDAQAFFCPMCGVALYADGSLTPRSRDVALGLALVSAFCSWLYTYREDALKFWVGFGATAVASIAWVAGYSATKSRDWFVVWLGTLLAVWLWALVSQSTKDFASPTRAA